MSQTFAINYTEFDGVSDFSTTATLDVGEVTWMSIIKETQRVLQAAGYVFYEDFDMAAILEEEHDKLAGLQVPRN